jgi:RHS repeat-associated protein
VSTTTEYFLSDALGSVRQLTDTAGEITLSKTYNPYGENVSSAGDAQTSYGFTGEYTDSTGDIYLRARYYNPNDGRFLTKDTWGGQANHPLSLNRWNYTEGNPINFTDPSGHYSVGISGALLGLGQLQYLNFVIGENIFASIIDCSTSVYSQSQNQGRYPSYDLTGYLALAMTEHGKDWRVKAIANTLVTAEAIKHVNAPTAIALWLSAYVAFRELEGSEKVWDIKVGIKRELQTDGVILCGNGHNCKWVDYSTPGNIHFGYIAYRAKINYFVAAVAGGVLEQIDLDKQGLPLELLYCFQNAFPGQCDNPQDQAAVDFGYMLGEKYKNGISDAQLRMELNTYALWGFQKPPLSFAIPYRAQPQPNVYGANDFNN